MGGRWMGLLGRAALLSAVFAVSLVISRSLIPGVPGYSRLPEIAQTGLPAVIALLVSAGIGIHFMKPGHAVLLSLACALVALSLTFVPQQGGTGIAGLPESHQVPEGYVAFRFASSYTYVGSALGGPITDVELELPWPYIDDYDEVGRPAARPVGLDRWLIKDNLTIHATNNEKMAEWIVKVWKLENVEPSHVDENLGAFYDLENGIWCLENSVDYTQAEIENVMLSLDYNGRPVWVDGRVVGIYGERTAPPRVTARFNEWAGSSIFQKVVVKVSEMYPGESVTISGVFFVDEENALKVRIDDWIESGIWRTFKPEQENAPYISIWYSPQSLKTNSRWSAILEKYVNNAFQLLVRYDEEWENMDVGCGLIDGAITRG